MSDVRLSQEVLEVLSTGDSSARLSQTVLEVLSTGTASAQLSQVVLEVLSSPVAANGVRLSQVVLETLSVWDETWETRVSQLGQAAVQATLETRVSQLGGGGVVQNPFTRVSQIAAIIVYSIPCPGILGPPRQDGLLYAPPFMPQCAGTGTTGGPRTGA